MEGHPPTRRRVATRTLWRTLAVVLVAGLCLAGLGIAGYLVLVMVALGSYGSNK